VLAFGDWDHRVAPRPRVKERGRRGRVKLGDRAALVGPLGALPERKAPLRHQTGSPFLAFGDSTPGALKPPAKHRERRSRVLPVLEGLPAHHGPLAAFRHWHDRPAAREVAQRGP
jgi:hypothetical protein